MSFRQIEQNEDLEARLIEHTRDGKDFTQAKYLDDLDGRIASRDIEDSSLHHNKNNQGQLNKKRLDGGFITLMIRII